LVQGSKRTPAGVRRLPLCVSREKTDLGSAGPERAAEPARVAERITKYVSRARSKVLCRTYLLV
jgi:hypothetical protein